MFQVAFFEFSSSRFLFSIGEDRDDLKHDGRTHDYDGRKYVVEKRARADERGSRQTIDFSNRCYIKGNSEIKLFCDYSTSACGGWSSAVISKLSDGRI